MPPAPLALSLPGPFELLLIAGVLAVILTVGAVVALLARRSMTPPDERR